MTFKPWMTVLGAAAVLDARFEAFDAEQKRKTSVTTLGVLEAGNFRSALDRLRECFATIAAKAAEGDRLATESYIDFLAKVDESRTWLISALLKEASHLISTPEGLNLVLPELYSGLMGTSNLVRATAAETLGRAGKSRISDLPQLVLEAFVLLLSDRYVIVHQAAAGALESIPLPPHLEKTAGLAVLQLIGVYRSEQDTRGFLPRCIKLYLHRFANEEQLKGGLAAWFIRLLMAVPASSNLRELNSMSRFLKDQPLYVDLVIGVLDDQAVREFGEEDAVRLAYLIPDAEVLERADELAKVAVRKRDRGLYVGAIVEILTRAGAWEQAITAVEASWQDLPDTVPVRRMKWARRMQVVAVRFEAAIAAGDAAQRTALKAEWERLVKALDDDEKQYAERRNPLPSFLRTHRGD
jgi:HEAT repeat protein